MADERDRSEFHKRLVDAIRAHVRIGLGKNALKQAQAGESIMPNYGEAEALADSLAETLKAMGLVVVDAEELHLSEERGNHFAGRCRDHEELLGAVWLYISWRYVTKQLTTEQKNLFADSVDAYWRRMDEEDGSARAERWWTDEYSEDRSGDHG